MSYDDIINLPHYVSAKRPRMSMTDRAAQFSSFVALVGFDNEIAETNRQVEQFAMLDENYLQELDEKLRYIRFCILEQPFAEITYFKPDETKNGGEYRTKRGRIKKIDDVKQTICFADKSEIDIKRVTAISID